MMQIQINRGGHTACEKCAKEIENREEYYLDFSTNSIYCEKCAEKMKGK